MSRHLADEKILSLMSVGDKRVVLTFARANMNLSKAARLAYMSRQGMRYRLENVRKNTGFNPMDFHDLCRLVNAIEKERDEYDRYQLSD